MSKWLAAGRQRHGHALCYISIYGDVDYLWKQLTVICFPK